MLRHGKYITGTPQRKEERPVWAGLILVFVRDIFNQITGCTLQMFTQAIRRGKPNRTGLVACKIMVNYLGMQAGSSGVSSQSISQLSAIIAKSRKSTLQSQFISPASS